LNPGISDENPAIKRDLQRSEHNALAGSTHHHPPLSSTTNNHPNFLHTTQMAASPFKTYWLRDAPTV